MKHDDIIKLIADGFAVVPIAPGEKGPRITGWIEKVFTPEDFGPDDNVGVKNGEPSGWKVDVDLDCKQAVQIASAFLPRTGLEHGRASKPASHRWYVCEGAPQLTRKDPVDGAMLVELRSTRGQTVVPPSVHPSGELIEWTHYGKAAIVDKGILTRTVDMLAIASLLSRHLPEVGSWHDAAGAIAGFLVRCGFDGAETERIVWQCFVAAGDDRIEDRRRYARDTAARAEGGAHATGGPTLGKILSDGEKVIATISSWLGRGADDRIDQLNEHHFATRLGKDEVIGSIEQDGELVFQTHEMFSKRYRHVPVKQGDKTSSLGKMWLDHPRRRGFRKVTFAPPPIPCDPVDFNMWRGFAVEPSPDASGNGCARFLQHLEENICGVAADAAPDAFEREVQTYLLDYLAAMIQRPGEPGEAAIVLRGSMGTGKGMFVRYIAQLFGTHFIQVDKAKHVTGAFNQHLSGKVLVFADEAVWAGNKSDLGALKRMITEATLTVERKGFDAIQERNVIHLIMATNEHWAIPAGLQERRFLFLDVMDHRRQDHAYFAALLDEMRDGGPSALLSYLMARDIRGVNLRAVPRTQGLRDQVERSVEPEVRWWRSKLEDGQFTGLEDWPDWMPTEELYLDYVEWCHRGSVGHRSDNVSFVKSLKPFWMWLDENGRDWNESSKTQRRAILRDVSGRKDKNGGNMRRWGYELPSLGMARRRFDVLTGIRGAWQAEVEVDPGDPPPF